VENYDLVECCYSLQSARKNKVKCSRQQGSVPRVHRSAQVSSRNCTAVNGNCTAVKKDYGDPEAGVLWTLLLASARRFEDLGGVPLYPLLVAALIQQIHQARTVPSSVRAT